MSRKIKRAIAKAALQKEGVKRVNKSGRDGSAFSAHWREAHDLEIQRRAIKGANNEKVETKEQKQL